MKQELDEVLQYQNPTKTIINKWTKLGFLEHINDDIVIRNTALAYEYTQACLIDKITEDDKYESVVIFPIMRRVFREAKEGITILDIMTNVINIIKDFSPKYITFLETYVENNEYNIDYEAEFIRNYCENYKLNLTK